MTVQELATQHALRALRAENELKRVKKEREKSRALAAHLTRKVVQLERQNELLLGQQQATLGRYHRYWVDRFTPAEIIALASSLEADG